jgi:hypothetical protein
MSGIIHLRGIKEGMPRGFRGAGGGDGSKDSSDSGSDSSGSGSTRGGGDLDGDDQMDTTARTGTGSGFETPGAGAPDNSDGESGGGDESSGGGGGSDDGTTSEDSAGGDRTESSDSADSGSGSGDSQDSQDLDSPDDPVSTPPQGVDQQDVETVVSDFDTRFAGTNIDRGDVSLQRQGDTVSASLTEDAKNRIRSNRAETTAAFLDQSRVSPGVSGEEALKAEIQRDVEAKLRERRKDMESTTLLTDEGVSAERALRDEAEAKAKERRKDMASTTLLTDEGVNVERALRNELSTEASSGEGGTSSTGADTDSGSSSGGDDGPFTLDLGAAGTVNIGGRGGDVLQGIEGGVEDVRQFGDQSESEFYTGVDNLVQGITGADPADLRSGIDDFRNPIKADFESDIRDPARRQTLAAVFEGQERIRENPALAGAATAVALAEPTPIGEVLLLGGAGTAAIGADVSRRASEIDTPEDPGLDQTEVAVDETGGIFGGELNIRRNPAIEEPELVVNDQPGETGRATPPEISVPTEGADVQPSEIDVLRTSPQQIFRQGRNQERSGRSVPEEFIPDEEVVIGDPDVTDEEGVGEESGSAMGIRIIRREEPGTLPRIETDRGTFVLGPEFRGVTDSELDVTETIDTELDTSVTPGPAETQATDPFTGAEDATDTTVDTTDRGDLGADLDDSLADQPVDIDVGQPVDTDIDITPEVSQRPEQVQDQQTRQPSNPFEPRNPAETRIDDPTEEGPGVGPGTGFGESAPPRRFDFDLPTLDNGGDESDEKERDEIFASGIADVEDLESDMFGDSTEDDLGLDLDVDLGLDDL